MGAYRENTRQLPAPLLGRRGAIVLEAAILSEPREDMWNQTYLASLWLGLHSHPANAGHPQREKQNPLKIAKYNQRSIKSHNRHRERPTCPSACRPITGRHHSNNPLAMSGHCRARESRLATGTADQTATFANLQASRATGGPKPPHLAHANPAHSI